LIDRRVHSERNQVGNFIRTRAEPRPPRQMRGFRLGPRPAVRFQERHCSTLATDFPPAVPPCFFRQTPGDCIGPYRKPSIDVFPPDERTPNLRSYIRRAPKDFHGAARRNPSKTSESGHIPWKFIDSAGKLHSQTGFESHEHRAFLRRPGRQPFPIDIPNGRQPSHDAGCRFCIASAPTARRPRVLSAAACILALPAAAQIVPTSPTVLNSNAPEPDNGDFIPRLATDGDPLFIYSTNDGATWSDPALLNTNAATDSEWDTFSDVVADGKGKWIAVWHSPEDLGGTIGEDDDIFMATFSFGRMAAQEWLLYE
jgi:hypothetical protein